MVVRVAQICEKVVPKESVYIATESEKIKEAVSIYKKIILKNGGNTDDKISESNRE